MSAHDVASNTDKVVSGYPLPQDGVLNNVHLEVHMIGPEGETWQTMSMYGMSGFVIPVLDPDGGDTFDQIWDAQIPKDVAMTAGGFDIDTDATDTEPEWEIGTPDVSAIMDLVAGNPTEIFRRRKFLTVANSGVERAIIDAGADLKLATDFFKTDIRRRVRVPAPSVVLFGVSSPDTLITSTQVDAIPTEAEWSLLQYLEVALEQAFMSMVGLTEAGAESPYEESMAFIAQLVEDTVFEQTAASFVPTAWRVFTISTYDISVPGNIALGVLTSE